MNRNARGLDAARPAQQLPTGFASLSPCSPEQHKTSRQGAPAGTLGRGDEVRAGGDGGEVEEKGRT